MADSKTRVVISAETASAQSAIAALGAKIEGLTSNLNSMSSLMGVAKGAIGLLGTAATVDHFRGMIEGSIKAQAELKQVSERTGATVEALSGLKSVAKLSGTDLESVAGATQKLSKSMSEAQAGGEKQIAAFARIGVSAKDVADNMNDPARMMLVVAQHLDQFQDGAGKTALMMELMGKSGANMLPMMHDLAEAGELNAKVTTEQAEAADRLEKNQMRWDARMKGVYNTIAGEIVPVMNVFYEALIANDKQTQALTGSVKGLAADGSIKDWATSAAKTVGFVVDAFDGVVRTVKITGMAIGAVAADIGSLFQKGGKEAIKQHAIDFNRDVEKVLGAATFGEKLQAQFDKAATGAEKHAAATKPAIKANKELGAEAVATVSAYDSLIKSINQKIAVERAESDAGHKLTDDQKMRAELGAKLAEIYHKLNPAQKEHAQALIDTAVALKYHNAMMEVAGKLLDDAAKGYQASVEDMQKETAGLVESTQKMRDHNLELIGGAEAVAELQARRLDDAIAAQEEALRIAEVENATGSMTKAIRENIAALKDKKAATGESVAAAQFKKQADEWKRFTDDIERSLTDSLMRGFEQGGAAGGKQFIDSIRNMLKTAAFKIAVQAIVNPIMGAAGNALGIPGAGGQGGGAGGLIQTGSSLNTLINGGSGAGSIGAYGTFANSGIGSALGLSEEVMMMNETTGLLEASTVLTESGVAMSGAMSALSAAAPYVAAAVVIANAIGLFGKGGGPQVGQYGDIKTGGKYNTEFTMSGGDKIGNQALTESAMAQITALANIAGKKISDLSIQQGYKLDPEGSSQGYAYRRLYAGGQQLTGFGDAVGGFPGAKTFGKDDGAGVANYLGKLHTDELQALIKELSDPKLSAAADALMANFGELENSLPAYLTAQAAQKAMSQSLMTAEQKTAAATDELKKQFDSIGLSVPESADALKSLIDGLDLTTEHDQKLLASLNSLGPAFLSFDAATRASRQALAAQMGDIDKQMNSIDMSPLTRSLLDIANATANAVTQATKLSATEAELSRIRELGARQAQAMLDSQAVGAYTDLLNATGKKREALEFDLSRARAEYDTALSGLASANNLSVDTVKQAITEAGSLDAAVAKYYSRMGAADQARTIELVKAATRIANIQNQIEGLSSPSSSLEASVGSSAAAIESVSADTGARDAIAAQRRDLQEKLNALTLTSAQQLEHQRSALDESNRALFDQIQAITEMKQAEQELAAHRQAVANERKGLQDQFDNLTMTSAQLLEKQRNALDESNRSLFDQIQAASAHRAALDSQKNALQSTIDKFRSFTESLTKFRDSLLTGELSTLSPEQKYAAEASRFQDVSSRAQLGDVSAIGSIQNVAQSFLAASRGYYASTEQYATDFSSVQATIDRVVGVADRQSAIAQSQLDAIQALASAQTIQIPHFAAGGFHRGGLRLVGEHGPEIESTGPSMIFNSRQTRSMLGGGDDLSPLLRDVIVELRALVSQGGAVASVTVEKLEAVADKLDGTNRKLARAA